jgi:hypothetical protein
MLSRYCVRVTLMCIALALSLAGREVWRRVGMARHDHPIHPAAKEQCMRQVRYCLSFGPCIIHGPRFVDHSVGNWFCGRKKSVLPKPDPEYRTRQNVGGTLWYILYWKLRWKCRPHFAPCGTSVHFCMVTETLCNGNSGWGYYQFFAPKP